MSLLWTSPLGPVGLLLGGGALLLILQRQLSAPLRQRLPVFVILLGMAGWLLLRWQPAAAGQWWAWQAPLGLETGLGLQWDGQAWLAGWLLFFAALTAALLPGWQDRPGFTPSLFWIPFLLASGLLVITAATWSTLLSAWAMLLLFTGLLAGSPQVNAARSWTYLLLSGIFLLAVPLFNGTDSVLITLHTESLNIQAQLLFLLAVAILMAIYPFHLWLTPRENRWQGAQLALHLLPALAAFHLTSQFPLPLLGSISWVALGIAGLLGSAIAAWAAREDEETWIYITINRATWAMLAFSLSREGGGYRILLPLTAMALSLIIWALTTAMIPHQPGAFHRARTRWLRLLALIFLLGLPLTPGFSLNIHVGQLATTVLGFPGWMLVLLAQTLLVAALLRPISRAPDEDPRPDFLPRGRLTWMLALAVAFGLWWGMFPAALARTAGIMPQGLYSSVLAQIRTAGLATGWMTLLLPLLLGWLLARSRERIFAGLESWQKRIAETASLGWLDSLLSAGFHYLASVFGFAADILDGAGQFGWVLLALLIFWLLFRK